MASCLSRHETGSQGRSCSFYKSCLWIAGHLRNQEARRLAREKMREISERLYDLEVARAKPQKREEVEDSEVAGLARLGKCKLDQDALKLMARTYHSDHLGCQFLKDCRTDAFQAAQLPDLDTGQKLLDVVGLENAPLLPLQPDWASLAAHNRKHLKWVALLVPNPGADDIAAYLMRHGVQNPIYYVLASLRRLEWEPDEGDSRCKI